MANVGEWGKLELTVPDFSALDPLLEFIDQLKELLKKFADLLDALLTFLAGILDPLATLIQKLIDKLKELVESFLEDLGAYTILIPSGKRFMTTFMGLGDVTPPVSTHLFPEGPDLNDPNLTPEEQEFLINMNRYNGGNPAFYRTVLDSIHDKGDRNRPQFTSANDWIGGLVMMLGTNIDPFGFLDDLWSLKGLFGSLFDSTYVTTIPTAKGLTAEALTRPSTSGGKFTALLSWETMDTPFARLPDLGNTVLVPERQALIMVKNDISAATASNVVQLMGTRELTEGLEFGNAKVIYEGVFDITKVSHLYEIPDADPDDTYYFALAYKNRVWRSDENWTVDPGYALGYWDTSNIARLVPFPVLPGSTPPDWIRTPSFGDMFPDLAYFLRRLLGVIEDYANRLLAVNDLWKKYVEFLRAEVDRYEALVNEILDRIKRLTEMLKLPNATGGVYARVFKGVGGNQFFLSDLATSLSRSYPNAPPFHRGDEYVMGIIMLAGGNEALVDSFVGLLSLLFGIGSFDEDNLMGSIGDALTAAEAKCFGDDFSVIECVDEQFTESLDEAVVSCSTPTRTATEFGDDLSPLEVS